MTRTAIILRPVNSTEMRTRIIIRYVGISLLLVAVMMAISGVIAVLNDYDNSATPLIFSAFITFIIGSYPMIFVRPEANISIKEGIAIVVLSWIACCICGTIPYICYGEEFTLVNALFESISGFTTTGASILTDIEALPAGLLFWRASTAWVGGLGIVSLFSLIVPRRMDDKSVLSSAELSDLTRSQSSKTGKSFIRAMFTVYVILTTTCAIALKLTGMGWFDAVTNAMSTCSTCGFCVRNESIASYGNAVAELIIVVYMTICGISFMQLSTRSGRHGKRRLTAATRGFLYFLTLSIVAVSIDLMVEANEPVLQALRKAVFQMSSITTTTGFATADTTLWPPLCIIILLISSVICGCSGSTSGGMKMDRIVLMFAYIKQGFKKGSNPHRMSCATIDGKIISDNVAIETMKFALLYISLLFTGAAINTIGGMDLETGISASIACLGNVGPGFGSVGSMGNYAELPSFLKISSSIMMIAGRLEIIPLLSFIGLFVGKK